MEEVRDLQENANTVGHLLELMHESKPECLATELRDYARMMLREGYSNAQLYADLLNVHMRISGEVPEEQEDALLDTMDLLTGWCAPDARIH